MNVLYNTLKGFSRYLWSGWGAMASLFLLLALWQLGHERYGDLVLPAPLATFQYVWSVLNDANLQADVALTLRRALFGFVFSTLIGSGLGLLAGMFMTASMMSRPLVTVLMGMPPIAWIVLAMIWFGMTDTTVVFTVVVAASPIVFVGALQGARTLDNELNELARSFRLPWLMRLTDIYFPHLFSFLFPAWVAALGMSWKIVVMAELLASNDGVGAALAVARSQLDTTAALGLVMIMVVSLLCIEYLLLEPIKREVEQWRDQ